ncbi:hypothetical protein DEO16_02185 [Escherichia coli]|nr:hypothetical protein [Escherichia coli]EFJ4025149.1 hypothetical protein [Escherichia coli]TFX06041.1 hypothetical protein DEO16_02185 [Escherichia coli]
MRTYGIMVFRNHINSVRNTAPSGTDHWTEQDNQGKRARSVVSLHNNPAADFLPPCCPLTFNFVG